MDCPRTTDDILRDYEGTVNECKDMCDELNCVGFVRIYSNAGNAFAGRCYFRSAFTTTTAATDRDCYVPS